MRAASAPINRGGEAGRKEGRMGGGAENLENRGKERKKNKKMKEQRVRRKRRRERKKEGKMDENRGEEWGKKES